MRAAAGRLRAERLGAGRRILHGRRRLRTGPETQRVVLPRPGEVELVLDLPPGARAAFDAELIVGGLNPFGFEARGAFSHLRRFESDGSGRRYTALAFPGRCNYFVRAPGDRKSVV